jgi:hypothetical protein
MDSRAQLIVLHYLYSDLLRKIPTGWSAVRNDRTIIVRRADLAGGRFAVTARPDGFIAGFQCPSTGFWTKWKRFDVGDSAAAEIVRWFVTAPDAPDDQGAPFEEGISLPSSDSE